MFERRPQPDTTESLNRLDRRMGELEALVPADLGLRLAELEDRCRSLTETLATRDLTVEQLRLEQRILYQRADEAENRACKAAAGLLERVETIRRQCRGATSVAT